MINALANRSRLSAFICAKNKNPKDVHDATVLFSLCKASRRLDSSCYFVLLVVPILLALTVESMRYDACIAARICEMRMGDEKNQPVLLA